MKTLKFGKHPKVEDPKGRTFKLAKYFTPVLDPPPVVFDNLQRVYDKLRINNPAKLFPIDGNDQYGCCVVAGSSHATTLWDGLVGRKKIPTRCAVVRLYKKLTGSQDIGLNMLDYLKFWHNSGAFGEQVLAFAEIDPKNTEHVKQAVRLFGGVFLGFRVQENAIEDFNNHRIWQPGTLTDGGHAVYLTSYNLDTLSILTWGNVQLGSWDWWLATVDEAYAIISPEAKEPGFSPGFDFDMLQTDLEIVKN